MTELRKPDHIVYDEKEGYNAFKLEYGTSLSAPNIKKDDVSVFLQQSGTKVNHFFDQKFSEIKNELEKLAELYELNQLIYSSELRFEPVMGYTYHLYERTDKKKFLSLIGPNEWNMHYICSVTLNTDGQWVLQNGSSTKK
jgi:hypothetical protein